MYIQSFLGFIVQHNWQTTCHTASMTTHRGDAIPDHRNTQNHSLKYITEIAMATGMCQFSAIAAVLNKKWLWGLQTRSQKK